MSSVRVGIVGCGAIGRLHLQRLLADGRAHVSGLFDPHETSAKQLAAEFSMTAPVFDNLEDMLASAEMDAVVICSPTAHHFPQAKLCLEHGLQVLCEKPLSDSREKIQELVRLSQEENRLMMVAYQRRFQAPYKTLRREVQSGKWGKVRAVTAYKFENWEQGIAGTWRDDAEQNWGGFIGDAGSHLLDSILYCTGLKPTNVFGWCDNASSNVEITASISAKLSGEIPLTISFVGNAQRLREEICIHTKNADLMIRDEKLWLVTAEGISDFPEEELESNSNPDTGFLDV